MCLTKYYIKLTICITITTFFVLADLESEVDTLREEVLRLKGTVSSLDRERDLLQQEVDQKAEFLVSAETAKARQVNELIESIV